MADRNVTRSHIFNGLTELPRLGLEYCDFLLNKKDIAKDLPRGDGRPVLFIPGFLTDDKVMAPLRHIFTDLGYTALPWECGTNWGSSKDRLERLKNRFEDLIAAYPDEKISIVGWSLGGIYARELARTYPDHVSCVITLGSPFAAGVDKDHINPVLRRVYEVLNPRSPLVTDEELQRQAMTPPPVPTTSVFSKADGIVNWRASLNPDTPLSENLDITDNGARGQALGHSGMKINKAVITIIADRLTHADKRPWPKFPVEKYPALKTYIEKAATPHSDDKAAHYKQVKPAQSRLFQNGPDTPKPPK